MMSGIIDYLLYLYKYICNLYSIYTVYSTSISFDNNQYSLILISVIINNDLLRKYWNRID